jgi:hypothetical protein
MRQLGVSRARTSAVKPSIRYDRTIPDEFRAELSPGGTVGLGGDVVERLLEPVDASMLDRCPGRGEDLGCA